MGGGDGRRGRGGRGCMRYFSVTSALARDSTITSYFPLSVLSVWFFVDRKQNKNIFCLRKKISKVKKGSTKFRKQAFETPWRTFQITVFFKICNIKFNSPSHPSPLPNPSLLLTPILRCFSFFFRIAFLSWCFVFVLVLCVLCVFLSFFVENNLWSFSLVFRF